MKKFAISLLFLLLGSGIFGYSQQYKEISSQTRPSPPVKLVIPALSVIAPVENVGKDKENRMDIPKNVYNAGWYYLGVRPGEIGNAVIAGHVNTPTFAPSIFSRLSDLKNGDTVSVEDQDKRVWNFRVVGQATYSTDNFPIEEVFGASNKKRLNLITCSGEWQKNTKDYSQRTVVFTELTSSS